jgi:drug/metabolite transporter (DMT)-like permease
MSLPKLDHRQGIWIAALGVVVLSFDALLVRLAATDPMNIAFWRGTLIFVSVTLFIQFSGQRKQWRLYRAHGGAALLVTLIYGVNSGLFVFSVSHTSVANTVVILSSSAFFAAFFSWLLLRERVALRTWIAIAVSVAGVLVVFAGSLGQPGSLGDALAIVLALSMGLTLTLLRRMPDLPKMPVVAVSGIVLAVLTWPLSSPLGLAPEQYGWLAVMGLVQMPIASVLVMMATRYLPSPEVSLFLLIETVLGPLWVLWVLNEAVPPLTLVGGSAILGAVAVHSWVSLRRETPGAI